MRRKWGNVPQAVDWNLSALFTILIEVEVISTQRRFEEWSFAMDGLTNRGPKP